LRRALLLAHGGMTTAALADARGAAALGARPKDGSDPIEWIKRETRAQPSRPLALPRSTTAYGMEPDFDPRAARCQASASGPRAAMARAETELRDRASPSFKPDEAVRAVRGAQANAGDPRAALVERRALAHARWQLISEGSGAPRVARPRLDRHEGITGPDGLLRPRVATGAPYPAGEAAIISSDRPARASITGVAGARGRVEIACVALAQAEITRDVCPIEVILGTGAPLAATWSGEGRGRVEIALTDTRGKAAELTLRMRPEPGRWVALARLVFDRELPGTAKGADGWVLEVPRMQRRFLVQAGANFTVRAGAPGIVRVDARAEPGSAPSLTASIDGREQPIPVDGEPHVLAVERDETITLRARGAGVTVRVAKRVATENTGAEGDDRDDDEEDASASSAPAEGRALTSSGSNAAAAEGTWRDIARGSPRPLTSLEAALGTLVVGAAADYRSMNDGPKADDTKDGYVQPSFEYRRRIETLSLWTALGGHARVRSGEPSYGAYVILYEDYDPLRLRVMVSGFGAMQRVEGASARSIQPRGFIEFSGRATSDFFILPRLGFDGFYSSLGTPPKSTSGVDDDVFDPFRSNHSTLVFGQLLLWWVPTFNDIFYMRARATFDAKARTLTNVALRPGIFLAFGDLELDGFGQGALYPASASGTGKSALEALLGASAVYHAQAVPGSFSLNPGVAATLRPGSSGYEITAFVDLYASYRRGLRDFSSLELSFPEQLSGGIPWRGASEVYK
jgi:hypothetical protein